MNKKLKWATELSGQSTNKELIKASRILEVQLRNVMISWNKKKYYVLRELSTLYKDIENRRKLMENRVNFNDMNQAELKYYFNELKYIIKRSERNKPIDIERRFKTIPTPFIAMGKEGMWTHLSYKNRQLFWKMYRDFENRKPEYGSETILQATMQVVARSSKELRDQKLLENALETNDYDELFEMYAKAIKGEKSKKGPSPLDLEKEK